jgi:hypothetical protein
MKILFTDLTDEQKQFCEAKLKRWDMFASDYTKDMYSYGVVGRLLKYEIDTRRRRDVMSRLAGRYAKLVRIDNWQLIQAYIDITPAEVPVVLEEVE